MSQYWNVQPCTLAELRCLTDDWCISPATLKLFLDDIYIVTKESGQNESRNIGFPLRHPGREKVLGYELVNFGYWDRLLNTATENGYWIVQPDLPPACIERLMFFQDAIDMMSFCQMKKTNLETTALVSVGKELTTHDLEQLIAHFPLAKFVSCFENSVKGNIWDVTLALAVAGKTGHFSIIDNTVEAEVSGDTHHIPITSFRLAEVRKLFSLKYTPVVANKPKDTLNFSEQLIKSTHKIH